MLTELEDLRGVVERFIAGAERPAVLDPGEEPLPLIPGQWDLREWSGRLVLEVWDTRRNLVRKISALKHQRRDRLALVTERFPKIEAELQIADLAAPDGREWERRSSREAFRERFQLMLAREFPDWRVLEVSIELNLEQSLSATYVRGLLRKGSAGIAVMAATPDMVEPSGIVAAALIWLAYLRKREELLTIRGMCLFVPRRREAATAARVKWLDPANVRCELFAYDERDRLAAIDPGDAGNMESTLPPCRQPHQPNVSSSLPEALPPDVERVEQSDGSLSLRVRGLEFARVAGNKLTCGIGRRSRCRPESIVAMAREILRIRDSRNDDRHHPLYSANPEGWLEAQVRADVSAIDATLSPMPLYGQVPVFAGPDRGVIDLLGIDTHGRLAVIEIKATEDWQLPFQALDYWIRVSKHLAAGDFERQGYFAGRTVLRDAPRIVLVSPALEFHSTSETLISSLDPAIEFMRIGLAADWRRELRVVFRLFGAQQP